MYMAKSPQVRTEKRRQKIKEWQYSDKSRTLESESKTILVYVTKGENFLRV